MRIKLKQHYLWLLLILTLVLTAFSSSQPLGVVQARIQNGTWLPVRRHYATTGDTNRAFGSNQSKKISPNQAQSRDGSNVNSYDVPTHKPVDERPNAGREPSASHLAARAEYQTCAYCVVENDDSVLKKHNGENGQGAFGLFTSPPEISSPDPAAQQMGAVPSATKDATDKPPLNCLSCKLEQSPSAAQEVVGRPDLQQNGDCAVCNLNNLATDSDLSGERVVEVPEPYTWTILIAGLFFLRLYGGRRVLLSTVLKTESIHRSKGGRS